MWHTVYISRHQFVGQRHLDQSLQHIINGCRKGQLQSQELLYRHFYPEMIKVCYRYAANADDAGSIYNNAMLKILNNLHTYSEQGQLFSWIKAIVINCCIDYCKKKNIFKNVKQEPAENEYSINPDVFDRVSYQEILKTIALLPGATAAVFRLYVFDGFTHRQIGEQLGISEGTSKWHVSEGKKLLKKKFEPVTVQKIINHAT